MSEDEKAELRLRERLIREQQQRAPLVQCSTCGAVGTGRPITLPVYRSKDRRYRHTGCNGVFVAYDTSSNAKPSRREGGTTDRLLIESVATDQGHDTNA